MLSNEQTENIDRNDDVIYAMTKAVTSKDANKIVNNMFKNVCYKPDIYMFVYDVILGDNLINYMLI